MKKKLFNNKYFFTFITVICSGAGLMLIFLFVFANNAFMGFVRRILTILAPIIYGFAIAYIMNPLMNFIESKVIGPFIASLKLKIKDSTKRKVLRFLSIVLTIITYAVFIVLFVKTLVPEIISSIETFAKNFPTYADNTMHWFDSILADYPKERKILESYYNDYSEELETYLSDKLIPKAQSIVASMTNNVLSTVIGFIKVMFNLVIGAVVSVYLLFRKEQFGAQSKKLLYSVLPQKAANAIISETRFINKTFTGFFTGKILDSIIVGAICFIITTMLNIPYALMVSLIIGFTNIIPVFGPIVGAIPCLLIIVMVDPKAALVFAIIVIIIQQIDGNILGPKILGDSIGLPSFWVLFSILVFGNLFGALGILIGVPAFAVIYNAIKRFSKWRLHKKGLPESTTAYTYLDTIEDGTLKLMTEDSDIVAAAQMTETDKTQN